MEREDGDEVSGISGVANGESWFSQDYHDSNIEKSYSTLALEGSHQNSRLVLTKAKQEKYPRKEVPDFQLPAFLDRERSSIPTITLHPQKQIEI